MVMLVMVILVVMVMMLVGALCVCAKEVGDASCITLMNWEAAHTYNALQCIAMLEKNVHFSKNISIHLNI